MIRCHALGRLIDPHTRKCIAAYGWLSTNQYKSRYWVSVETDAYLFFNNHDDAREIYRQAADRLRARASSGRPMNYRRRHDRTLAALAGGKGSYAA